MKVKSVLFSIAIMLAVFAVATQASAWSLEEAAKPYAGTELEVVFLLRPGYEAAEKMIPEFEMKTGIKINIIKHPYENSLGEQVRDFVADGDLDIALIDLVWIGNFAENEWILPIDKFTKNPDLVDPDLDIDDFFPLALNAFGGWNGVVYGLPFDNYSGLMFYNKQHVLKEAGFDRPPATWSELKDVYGPKLTQDGKYAFALQSKRNETQAADSFARVLWPFGGSFLDPNFKFSWNELMYALVLTRKVAKTAPAMAVGFMEGYHLPYGKIMATSTLIVIPVIVFALIASKHLVRGLTMGAVK